MMMVPIMIPLTTTTKRFTFSGRFSTVGFSAGTEVTLLEVPFVVAFPDVERGSNLIGKVVVTAAMTFNIFRFFPGFLGVRKGFSWIHVMVWNFFFPN